MRPVNRRPIFYALAVVLIAGGVTALWWSLRPESEEDRCTARGAFIPPNTAECVAALSDSETKVWWSRWQRLFTRAGSGNSVRENLEACANFGMELQSRLPVCPGDLLGGVEADWADLAAKTFKGVRFPDKDKRARLAYANLMGAKFEGGDARGIVLTGALLRGAKFDGINLEQADFGNADMRDVRLISVNAAGASFAGANLDGMHYEPRSPGLPDVSSFASALNLPGLTYRQSPQALSELREALYKAGLPAQAQQVTFAIERTRRMIDGWSLNPFTVAASWARLVAFEWTADYGMAPFRPLLILLVLIPAFVPFYVWAGYASGQGGIWLRRPAGAINRKGSDRWIPVRDVVRGRGVERFRGLLKVATWFSLMCAFRIGYREFNVGDWITRLQPKEYLIGATGWCRTVSGLQSLLSVYLLALTVLCIVGRPFG
jgi:hypothetical protein